MNGSNHKRESGREREGNREQAKEREGEREAIQREDGSGAIAIGLACQQWWTGNCLPGKGEQTNASNHPRVPHHSSISSTEAGACVRATFGYACVPLICRFWSACVWPSFTAPFTAKPVWLERLNGRNEKWQLLTGRSQELFCAEIGASSSWWIEKGGQRTSKVRGTSPRRNLLRAIAALCPCREI